MPSLSHARHVLIIAALLLTGAATMDAPLPQVDQLVVDKTARTLRLYSEGRLVGTITGLQLGDVPVGHKRFEGDERTPEGRYLIDYGNPDSAYHLSLHISYPNAADIAYAEAQGRSPGGQIFIHGQPNALTSGRMRGDWTDGCIAVSNAEMELLWQTVPDGAVIDILP
jgi:murein L,D-transpeptidase YafK